MMRATYLELAGLAFMALTNPAIAQDEAPTQILFTNVNVFDGSSESLQEGMSVLVEGNLIKAISSSSIAGVRFALFCA